MLSAANFPIEIPEPPISVKIFPSIRLSLVPEIKSKPVAAICVKMLRSKISRLAFVTVTPAFGRHNKNLLLPRFPFSGSTSTLNWPACKFKKPSLLGLKKFEFAKIKPLNFIFCTLFFVLSPLISTKVSKFGATTVALVKDSPVRGL